jgi:hypothetical protein
MSNLSLRIGKLESEVMGGQQITIILRACPFYGVEPFDPQKNPERFRRITVGWPSNYIVLKELTGEDDE